MNFINKINTMEEVNIIEVEGQSVLEDFSIKMVVVGDSGVGVC